MAGKPTERLYQITKELMFDGTFFKGLEDKLKRYAQIYSKYNTDLYEKLEFDLLYINNMSLLREIELIFATFFNTHYLPNITGLGTAVEHPGLMQKLTTRLYKVGVAGADCVFFQNTENKMFFEQHNMLNTKTKIRLLPGSGVSLKIHKPLSYPTEEDIISFLFIARIMKEKGIELYLNAAKRIYEGHKNVMFHICGYCDDNSYLQRIKDAEKDGYIAYHGEQKDMIPFF